VSSGARDEGRDKTRPIGVVGMSAVFAPVSLWRSRDMSASEMEVLGGDSAGGCRVWGGLVWSACVWRKQLYGCADTDSARQISCGADWRSADTVVLGGGGFSQGGFASARCFGSSLGRQTG
jgi:hypothetical protein